MQQEENHIYALSPPSRQLLFFLKMSVKMGVKAPGSAVVP